MISTDSWLFGGVKRNVSTQERGNTKMRKTTVKSERLPRFKGQKTSNARDEEETTSCPSSPN